MQRLFDLFFKAPEDPGMDDLVVVMKADPPGIQSPRIEPTTAPSQAGNRLIWLAPITPPKDISRMCLER